MATFIIVNGLDQGDPFSGICYLIYNANLLKIPILKVGEQVLLFVDDAVIIVIGKNFMETHEKLHNIMNQTGGVFEWVKAHNCEFSIKKFQLLDITKKCIPHPINPKKRIPMPCQTLVLGNQQIPSKEMAKFLGIIVDNKLTWKGQGAVALAKGQDWLIQFARIACSSQGINARYIWQLYLSIAVP